MFQVIYVLAHRHIKQGKDQRVSSWSNGKAMAVNAISWNLSPTSKPRRDAQTLMGQNKTSPSARPKKDLRQTDATLKDQTIKVNRYRPV